MKCFEHREAASRLSGMTAVGNVELATAAGTAETLEDVGRSRCEEEWTEEGLSK